MTRSSASSLAVRGVVAILLVGGLSACGHLSQPPEAQIDTSDLRLIVPPSAHPGETITIDVAGADADEWFGSAGNDLEVWQESGWAPIYVLFVDWGRGPMSVPIPNDVEVPAIGLPPGPSKIAIPAVPDGEYRIRRKLVRRDPTAQSETVSVYATISITR